MWPAHWNVRLTSLTVILESKKFRNKCQLLNLKENIKELELRPGTVLGNLESSEAEQTLLKIEFVLPVREDEQALKSTKTIS